MNILHLSPRYKNIFKATLKKTPNFFPSILLLPAKDTNNCCVFLEEINPSLSFYSFLWKLLFWLLNLPTITFHHNPHSDCVASVTVSNTLCTFLLRFSVKTRKKSQSFSNYFRNRSFVLLMECNICRITSDRKTTMKCLIAVVS